MFCYIDITSFTINMAKILGHAPIVTSLIAASLIRNIFLSSASVNFSLASVLSGDYISLVTSFITYEDRVQLAVGSVLLYILRVFENQFGSRKFGAMVFFSWVLAIALSIALSVVCDSMGVAAIKSVSGPYFLIFALLVLYYHNIPTLSASQYSIAGFGISEKTFTYILGLQLMSNSQIQSVAPAAIGLFIGIFYYSNQMGMQSWRLPGPLEKILSLPYALLGGGASSQSQHETRNNNATTQSQESTEGTNAHTGRQRSWSEATQERLHDYGGLGEAIQPPAEDQIKTLTDLGFDRSKAIHALEQCDNNVEAAANFILR
jgi:hypothetical protein